MFKYIASSLILFLVSHSSFAASDWMAELIAKKQHVSFPEAEMLRPSNLSNKNKVFFQDHALMLFFSSQCRFCQQFAPTLKYWADRQGAMVIPLTLDNQTLPQFPQFFTAPTELITAAFKGQSITYPALFVMNRQSKALYPVSVGAQSSSELEGRMRELIPKIIAYEHKGQQA